MEKAYSLQKQETEQEGSAVRKGGGVILPQLKLFQNAVAEIKERFFTAEEFPHLPRERFPLGVLERADGLDKKDLENYAYLLKGRELEGLLLDLCEDTSPSAIAAGVSIVTLRATNRLIRLFTQVWQYHYQKPGIHKLALALGDIAAKNGWEASRLLSLLAASEHHDPVLAIGEAIRECDNNIAILNKRHQLQSASPLALEAYLHFLKDADPAVLSLNKIYLAQVIRETAPERLGPLIANYLRLFDIDTYEQAVNLAIEKRLGQPYTGTYWDTFDEKLKKKFALWCFWYQLFKHFIHQPRKMKALSPYIALIRSTEKLPEQPDVLVIDFGDLVAVDIAGETYSFFYQDKRLFDSEMTAWREEGTLPAFLNRQRVPVTARDFIIESKEAPCIVLDYESVNFFYIKELLDIKMELEPDMRKFKLFRR